MGELFVIVVLFVAGYVVGYKYAQMKLKSSKKVNTNSGRTIVVDRTPVDTSKEDELKERFGDLK